MKAVVVTGLMAFCLAVSACRRSDLQTVTLHVPELKNSACVDRVSGVLTGQVGVVKDQVFFDVAKKTVQVTYDSMKLARKNLEFAVAEAGFSANDIPAKAEARAQLPPECR